MLPIRFERAALFIAPWLALGGCSSAAQQDRQNAQKARSLLAEWALLSESRQAGRLTDIYYAQMRDEAEKALTSLAESAPQSGSAAALAIAEIAQVHGEPPVSLLRRRADLAEAVETRLEAH